MAFHRLSQKDLPVALVGAGLPTLPVLLRGAKPYASRLFAYRDVGQLPPGAARAALVGPAEIRGVAFAPDAVEAVIRGSGGYPYFIQEYGRVLWNEVEQGAVSAAMGGASATRESLIDKELIWSPRRGFIDFTVPRFGAYLRALGE